jgi:signal transduction histidine kinase
MIRLNSKIKFGVGLFLFCCGYWLLDSLWAYLSFEKNLSYLIFREPMSYLDTLLLNVSPYQFVSRIMVTMIFIVSGTVIALFFYKRKKSEEEKIRLERQLLQAHKLESLGTLAGGIAHDFNNILYGIMGFTELCLDDAEPGSVLYENLQEIMIGSKRAKELISQILAFSKQTKEMYQNTLVADIVKEASGLLKATIPANITVEIDLKAETSIVNCDPTQIHQVIMNLCTNAVHAMEEKGGALTIMLRNVTLGSQSDNGRPTYCPAGSYLKVSVGDTGAGIPLELRDRIFDPFFTSKEQGKGIGMGLAVVHGIVRAHKGFIMVRCPEGYGAVFEVYLPLVEEPAAVLQ